MNVTNIHVINWFVHFFLTVIPGDYYQTMYTYDPSISSPNDDAEMELAFHEDDIVVVSSYNTFNDIYILYMYI